MRRRFFVGLFLGSCALAGAALAQGVLRELQATPIGDGRSLLDEVDTIVIVDNAQQPMQAAPVAALRQIAAAGLPKGLLRMTDPGLRTVIDEYTREAGVRQPERRLGACRSTRRSSSRPRFRTRVSKRSTRRRPRNDERPRHDSRHGGVHES